VLDVELVKHTRACILLPRWCVQASFSPTRLLLPHAFEHVRAFVEHVRAFVERTHTRTHVF
jgi:hypothetical protein